MNHQPSPPAHGVRSRIPAIEIAHQANGARIRGRAIKGDRFGDLSGPVTIAAGLVRRDIHRRSIFVAVVVKWMAARGGDSSSERRRPRCRGWALWLCFASMLGL